MAQYLAAPEGATSPGVAPGGRENEVLRKASDLNYDTEWVPSTEIVRSIGDVPNVDTDGRVHGSVLYFDAVQGKFLADAQVTVSSITDGGNW